MRAADMKANLRAVWAAAGGDPGIPGGVEPVEHVDSERYKGTWYEIARLDHPFERRLSEVTASYYPRAEIFKERENGLKNVVSMASGAVNALYARQESGAMTQAQAQADAFGIIDTMRFGAEADNYVFTFNSQASILSHPRRDPGSSMANYTDPQGKSVYLELIKVAKANGAGYVEYVSKGATAEDAFRQKVSYVSYFAPWDAYIAAGIYVDDVQAIFLHNLISYFLILLVVGAKLSSSRILRGIARVYTLVIRGVPDLVLMLLLFYGGQIGTGRGRAYHDRGHP